MPYAVRSLFSSSIICICLFGALLVTGCAGGDMAKVTINIGNHVAKTDRPSIVDRILAFLTFSTRLQADPPSVFFKRIDLAVSGTGMETIERTIPTDTGEITLDVPSGPKRVFTIVGYDDGDSRIMGGIATKDLTPGGNEIISIMMGDLPFAPDFVNGSSATGGPVTITWYYTDYSDPAGLVGFRIYRAPDTQSYTNPNDPSLIYLPVAIGRKENFGDNFGYELIFPASGLTPNRYLYFGVAAINQYGEGEPVFYNYFYC